jgi:hypothetical protein
MFLFAQYDQSLWWVNQRQQSSDKRNSREQWKVVDEPRKASHALVEKPCPRLG